MADNLINLLLQRLALPTAPAAPAKRLPTPASHGSDDNYPYDRGGGTKAEDMRLAERATKGSMIRPMRELDTGGIQIHDIRTAGYLSKLPFAQWDAFRKAEDDRYSRQLEEQMRDEKAG